MTPDEKHENRWTSKVIREIPVERQGEWFMSSGPPSPVVCWPRRCGLFGGAWLPVAIVLAMAAGPALAAPSPPDAAAWARLVEEDWLRQAETRAAQPPPMSTRADAAGAGDGVKNGQYGFHTGQKANPW